ncbi:MAG TPA: carbohydrate ABC transporter permease, partial [Arachnia sp.]|nr:carbohydrate ABC transporter permease [Arachnia sp.]
MTATAVAPAAQRRRLGANPLIYLVALIVAAFSLGPVLYSILGGFRSNAQLAENPAGLPSPWVWSNYEGVLTNPSFWRYGLNSLVIALLTTALVVVFGLMAAYPLSRYRFPGREKIYKIFVLGLLFPAT